MLDLRIATDTKALARWVHCTKQHEQGQQCDGGALVIPVEAGRVVLTFASREEFDTWAQALAHMGE